VQCFGFKFFFSDTGFDPAPTQHLIFALVPALGYFFNICKTCSMYFATEVLKPLEYYSFLTKWIHKYDNLTKVSLIYSAKSARAVILGPEEKPEPIL
jgi:hypothetical protein